jgi:hypothetical protein
MNLRASLSRSPAHRDTLAPILFLFVIQAAMETLELVFSEHGIKVPTFRTADDDVLTARKMGEAGETFTFGKGLYADDAGLLFETRADLELGARRLSVPASRAGGATRARPKSRVCLVLHVTSNVYLWWLEPS